MPASLTTCLNFASYIQAVVTEYTQVLQIPNSYVSNDVDSNFSRIISQTGPASGDAFGSERMSLICLGYLFFIVQCLLSHKRNIQPCTFGVGIVTSLTSSSMQVTGSSKQLFVISLVDLYLWVFSENSPRLSPALHVCDVQ